jgi:Fe-S-cluster containining protein
LTNKRYARSVDLIHIIDAALAEAAHKAGPWLVCGAGCAECCTGSFEISGLDAHRLRSGLAELEVRDPVRAGSIVERARRFTELAEDEADETACPALDPETQTCELYESRPLTCRLFGPPVRGASGAIGVCELCFHGATEEQIAACEMTVDAGALEQLEYDRDETTVAEALIAPASCFTSKPPEFHPLA